MTVRIDSVGITNSDFDGGPSKKSVSGSSATGLAAGAEVASAADGAWLQRKLCSFKTKLYLVIRKVQISHGNTMYSICRLCMFYSPWEIT